MVYHPGELAVQRQAGQAESARQAARGIHAAIPPIAAQFLARQRFLVLASVDSAGNVWASPVTGAPGFVTPLTDTEIRLAAGELGPDPLRSNVRTCPQVGLLALEWATRRRMRLNGSATAHDDGSLRIKATQVYSNCPKYIQTRFPHPDSSPNSPAAHVQRGTALDASQCQMIEQADTFFIATCDPDGGADASHKGGSPGFVKVLSPQHLLFPDYTGNAMYNTLGNLVRNPSAGLLFLDFATGRTLQLTGTATVHWEHPSLPDFPGAQRLVAFHVHQALASQGPNWMPLLTHPPAADASKTVRS